MSEHKPHMQEIIEQARQSHEEFMALIEGEWQTIRWTDGAYDGSPYGCTGFANEDMMATPEDLYEDVRWPEDGEAEYIPSAEEVNQERLDSHLESVAAAEEDARRIRREERAARRKDLESRYEHATGKKPVNMTMKQMRSEINEANLESSRKLVERVFRNFGF